MTVITVFGSSKVCDICREEVDLIDRDTISKISFGNYGIGSWIWNSEFDLCPECGKSLNEWINARKKQLSSNEDGAK
jgi:hypothetical protein